MNFGIGRGQARLGYASGLAICSRMSTKVAPKVGIDREAPFAYEARERFCSSVHVRVYGKGGWSSEAAMAYLAFLAKVESCTSQQVMLATHLE